MLTEGLKAYHEGNFVLAAELFAEERGRTPSSAQAAYCHATALIALEDFKQAEKALRDALQLNPSYVDAAERLVLLLHRQGRYRDALGLHNQLIEIQPQNARFWNLFGFCLSQLERYDLANRCYVQALRIDPASPDGLYGLATTIQKLGRFAEAVEAYERYLEKMPQDSLAWSQRLMAANHVEHFTNTDLWQAHKRFGEKFPPDASRRFNYLTERVEKLRVGFLSPDFRTHSVAYFIEPILKHLGSERFDVFLYHDSRENDPMTAKIRAHARTWRDVKGQDDLQLERTILGDQLHVLVDLAGHTGLNRISLLAKRLAPVQVNYLGYPNTTGLQSMDFRFVDPLSDPPGAGDALHSERLVRFSSCAWCYAPQEDTPEPVRRTRAEGTGLTFASFNLMAKVTDTVLRSWKQILDGASGSRLLLKSPDWTSPDLIKATKKRLAEAGLAEAKIELLPRATSRRAHLDLYNDVDVALDPYPFNGTTTTCEALWMGVPVVSLVGDRHASRVGYSLLSAVGKAEWACKDLASYLETALRLAREASSQSETSRLALRQAMLASPLMRAEEQARLFGDALYQVFQERVGGAA